MRVRAKIRGAWRSLTVWINGVAGSVLVLIPVAHDSFPAMQAYLTPDLYKWGMGGLVAANILLRFKTTMDLADKQ